MSACLANGPAAITQVGGAKRRVPRPPRTAVECNKGHIPCGRDPCDHRILVVRASDLLPLGQLEAPWSSWRANSVEALLVRLRSAPRVLWCLPVLETSQGAFLGSGRGPAGVVNLADSVEFPYWNETELRQIRHVTSLLPRLPRSESIAVTRQPPIEAYTYA